ncbi:hypothetical protein KKG45_11605 [bacterium]|nr:hypothetical protein [bacterium]MBU1073881.1 hypothetical protein [bacterium]MBU1676182.1 hypothetical protein [bacterium]
MEFLTVLWLPILLSAVLVFVASSIIHMVLKYHNSDYGLLPGEDAVLATMREQGVGPGMYAFPRASSLKEMGEPGMIAKYEQGPVGSMTVGPNGPPAMGKSLFLWFLYAVLIGVFAGYLGFVTRGPGAEYLAVFRITGTVAVLGHAVGYLVDGIWKGVSWGSVFKNVFDGLIYGLLTAGTFAWLWPEI